jgi:DNA-binding CsgD family transcriptional regulator
MIADATKIVTDRQLELLALYASGHDIAEIAQIKFLSYSSVSKTMATARERVGAKSLTHLCVVLVDQGLIRKNGVGYKPVLEERVIGE